MNSGNSPAPRTAASKFVEGRVVGLTPWTADLFSIQVEAAVKPFRAGQFGRSFKHSWTRRSTVPSLVTAERSRSWTCAQESSSSR